jgi:hypothetical protein
MESSAQIPSTNPATVTDVPKDAKCCFCGETPVRVNGEGPGSCRLWQCTECRQPIPQTKQGILHCNKKRCYYDLCHRCEQLTFPEGHSELTRTVAVAEGRDEDSAGVRYLLELIPDNSRIFVGAVRELQRTIVDSATAKAALDKCVGGSCCGILLAFNHVFRMSESVRRQLCFHPLQALIQFLAAVCSKLDDPRVVLHAFPKSCPGCFVLNLVCAAACYPGLEADVEECFRKICGDRRANVVERGEVAAMAKLFKDTYSRPCDPFPYAGNCLDFRQSANVAVATGKLLFATNIRTLLRNDEQRGISAAADYLRSQGKDKTAAEILGAETV